MGLAAQPSPITRRIYLATSTSALSPLLCDELSRCLEELLRCKWLSQRWHVIKQPVGIRHWITDMEYWQSWPLAADRPDKLSVGNGTPPGVCNQEIQVGNKEGQFAGRRTVVGGKNAVSGVAECAYQEGHEPGIVIGNDNAPRRGRGECH